jgi:hypothetical protein
MNVKSGSSSSKGSGGSWFRRDRSTVSIIETPERDQTNGVSAQRLGAMWGIPQYKSETY